MAEVHQRSEHERKYDRQMRLWGGHGQKNIEESHICVLGSGATASESLKNLVLPNIGEFTIVDDAVVSAADLGNNFFVTQDMVGQSRAEVVKNNMLEMNDTVKGHHEAVAVSSLLTDEKLSFFDKFNIVVSTQMYGADVETLATYLQTKNIPLIIARTNGLMGSIRLVVPEICIVESHPDDKRDDLYIYPKQLETFPELKEFIDSYDLKMDVELDESEESKKIKDDLVNVPAPVITSQRLATYIKENGKAPQTYEQKEAFKKWLCEGRMDMTNWEQAMSFAPIAYAPPRMGLDCQDVLKDDAGTNLKEDCDNFWVMVRGLKDFMEKDSNGFLPVTTAIPDFEADSKSYIKLKGIYKARAARDAELVKGYIEQRLESIGRPKDAIHPAAIERFVKNCRNLHIERMRTLKDEYWTPDIGEIHEAFDEFDMGMLSDSGAGPEKPKLVNWYFAFRSLDEFVKSEGRLPGSDNATIDADKEKLKACQKALFAKIKLERDDFDTRCLDEMVRFGGSEPHTVGAFLGGVVSQAVLKIVLRQYYPFNHTMIYDGIFCKAKTFKF